MFLQLLSLDMETMISRGIASLAHKQKLIEDALNQSYSITLGGGAFGRCLVWPLVPLSLPYIHLSSRIEICYLSRCLNY